MSGAWGSGGWGSGSWGGGPGLDVISFVDAQAWRENVVRVEFDVAVNLTGLLEVQDASRLEKWSVVADPSTVGISGDPARDVMVVLVTLATTDDGVAEEDFGRFVDLTLDRPMTPFPAAYDLEWRDVFASDLGGSTSGTARFSAAYRLVEQPQAQVARPLRDFANPQVLAAARQATAQPTDPYALGTFQVADDGDYAFDEGIASLKKRIIRRLLTRKGAFAHLPNYGVGIPDEAKRLGISAVLTKLSADAQAQIASEPDVAQARVQAILDRNNPGLVFFRVVVRPRVGAPLQFDVPFRRAA